MWLMKRRYGTAEAPYLGVMLTDNDGNRSSSAPKSPAAGESATKEAADGHGQTPVLSDADLIRIGQREGASATPSGDGGLSPPPPEPWSDEDASLALFRRGLYCKALLYVAGGDRRARDWIVGWACALQGVNAPLIPIIMRHDAVLRDVQRFWRELQGRELPLAHERLAANCLCLDAATVVALSGTVGAGAAAEGRYHEVGAMVGATPKWLEEALELAVEERQLVWEKADVLQGGSSAGGSSGY